MANLVPQVLRGSGPFQYSLGRTIEVRPTTLQEQATINAKIQGGGFSSVSFAQAQTGSAQAFFGGNYFGPYQGNIRDPVSGKVYSVFEDKGKRLAAEFEASKMVSYVNQPPVPVSRDVELANRQRDLDVASAALAQEAQSIQSKVNQLESQKNKIGVNQFNQQSVVLQNRIAGYNAMAENYNARAKGLGQQQAQFYSAPSRTKIKEGAMTYGVGTSGSTNYGTFEPQGQRVGNIIMPEQVLGYSPVSRGGIDVKRTIKPFEGGTPEGIEQTRQFQLGVMTSTLGAGTIAIGGAGALAGGGYTALAGYGLKTGAGLALGEVAGTYGEKGLRQAFPGKPEYAYQVGGMGLSLAGFVAGSGATGMALKFGAGTVKTRMFYQPLKGDLQKVLGIGEVSKGLIEKQPFYYEAIVSKPKSMESILGKAGKVVKGKKLLYSPGIETGAKPLTLSEKSIARILSGVPSTSVKQQPLGFKFFKGKAFFGASKNAKEVLNFGDLSLISGKVKMGKSTFTTLFKDFGKGTAKTGRLESLMKAPAKPFSELQTIFYPSPSAGVESAMRGTWSKTRKKLGFGETNLFLPEKASKSALLGLPTPERGLSIRGIRQPTTEFFSTSGMKAGKASKGIASVLGEVPSMRQGVGISFFPKKPSVGFVFADWTKAGKSLIVGATEKTKAMPSIKFLSIAQPLSKVETIKTTATPVFKQLGFERFLLGTPEAVGTFNYGIAPKMAATLEKLSIRKDAFGAFIPKSVPSFVSTRNLFDFEAITEQALKPQVKTSYWTMPTKTGAVTMAMPKTETSFFSLTGTGTGTITITKPKTKTIFGETRTTQGTIFGGKEKITSAVKQVFGEPQVGTQQGLGLVSTSKTKVGTSVVSLLVPRQGQKSQQRLNEMFGVKQESGLRYGLSTKQLLGQLEKTSEKQSTSVATILGIVQAQRYKYGTRTFERTLTQTKPLETIKPIPFFPPFTFKLPSERMPKLGEGFGYKVLVRGKGAKAGRSWIKGGFQDVLGKVLSREQALMLGQKITAGTAKRSFKIEPAFGEMAFFKGSKFRPEMFTRKGRTYIEKTKYAIDQPGEFFEITAKGKKARRSGLFGFGASKATKPLKKNKKKHGR